MSGHGTRSEEAIGEARRREVWTAIRWIRRRRPLLTALLVLAPLGHTLVSGTAPLDLLDPLGAFRPLFAWVLMLFGGAVRLWGSGNLRKNQEITDTGIYVLVRHPLYVGSLSFLLAYFLTVGNLWMGLGSFAILVALVYYPTMLAEEEHLTLKFPEQFSGYSPPPRLLPDLRRVPEALRSDRFDLGVAYRNLGFRSFWFLILLPLFLRILAWTQSQIH